MTRLSVTQLEDRLTPAGFGNTWIDTNLTASFAPNGTTVNGVGSVLYSMLDARASRSEWQGAIRAAFQAWTAPANLNVGFVSDDGRAFGTAGPVQGSPFVGDIRIAARPLSGNVLAISNPFDLVSPWAGEIVLNSNVVFDTDGSPNTFDLKAVLFQEVGHVLGIGNSTDPASVMYEVYAGPRAGLSAADTDAITDLYGTRSADRYESFYGNETPDRATTLKYISFAAQLAGIDPAASSTRYVAEGDIRTAADTDTYKVALPAGESVVLVQTGGISRAALRVAVLDATGAEKAATTSYNPSTGRYSIQFQAAAAGDYFVKVTGSTGTPASVGSYRLAVGLGLSSVPNSDLSTRVQTPAFGYDSSPDWVNGVPRNDSISTAQGLGWVTGSSARWEYAGSAGVDTAADQDVYAVGSMWASGGVLVVSVWSETGSAPSVQVLDKNGSVLPVTSLVRNGPTTILQVSGVEAWTTYYVRVKAADPAAWAGRQAYRFGIDYRNEPVALESVASGTLTAASPQMRRQLSVTRSELFAFDLAAQSLDSQVAAARLTVFNSAGQPVLSIVSKDGVSARGTVLLAPGEYTVVITGSSQNGSPLSGLAIDARFLSLSDPIGPAATDAYSTLETGSVNTGYIWITTVESGSTFLSLTNPYSSAWW